MRKRKRKTEFRKLFEEPMFVASVIFLLAVALIGLIIYAMAWGILLG